MNGFPQGLICQGLLNLAYISFLECKGYMIVL